MRPPSTSARLDVRRDGEGGGVACEALAKPGLTGWMQRTRKFVDNMYKKKKIRETIYAAG